eukprot:910218-Alexandrium_andersonii.AAC.1
MWRAAPAVNWRAPHGMRPRRGFAGFSGAHVSRSSTGRALRGSAWVFAAFLPAQSRLASCR